jgi:hypothetical protein
VIETARDTVTERALCSQGISNDPIYQAVARALGQRHPDGGLLLDVGCGKGNLWPHLAGRFDDYLGADVVRYPGLPDGLEFCAVDLDSQCVPLPDDTADVVAAVETIECLVAVEFSQRGRIPGTPWHYPVALSRCLPRPLSDNLVLVGTKVV